MRHASRVTTSSMSTLAKLVRLQPRSTLTSFRLQATRTLSIAARLHRPSLTRAISSSWSPVSMRNFSTEPEGNNKRQKRMPKPSRSLFVSNVPQYASNEHLREIFSPYGVIDHVYIYPADQGSHKGCARVDFRKQEDATTVQQSGQAEPFFLMDQALHVDYSTNPCYPKTHVLFFRHFSGNEEDLRAILNDYKDRITEIAFVPPFKEGQLWDRGIIVFGNEDSDIAEEVLAKFNGQMTALGCRMDLEYSSMKPRWGTQVPS